MQPSLHVRPVLASPGELPNLDSLRAVAVLSVYVAHVLYTIGLARGESSGAPDFGWFLGRFGVLVFFVHTRFVLMMSLERMERDKGPLFRAFYVRRWPIAKRHGSRATGQVASRSPLDTFAEQCDVAVRSRLGLQALEEMFDTFADFVVAERVAMDDIFANAAIGEAVQATVEEIENNSAFVILDGVDVNARGTVEAVPAAVVAADEARCIQGSCNAFAELLHGELVVHQEVGVVGIAHLNKATGVESLVEGAGNAVANDVIFPVGVALIGRRRRR